MSEDTINITDDTFEKEVLESELPVLIDFWAEWCAPCKMIDPIVESLAQKYKGKLKVCSMDVDENMITPSKFSIRSIPCLLLFKDGELKDTIIGAVPREKIEEVLSKHL
ncbi:MAG: thioredoxin [Candidatus Aminicenantaceae bacterium]